MVGVVGEVGAVVEVGAVGAVVVGGTGSASHPGAAPSGYTQITWRPPVRGVSTDKTSVAASRSWLHEPASSEVSTT